MAKNGGKHYKYFMFYHNLALDPYWQKVITKVHESKPFYLLTRNQSRWHLRIPTFQYGEVRHVGIKTLTQNGIFNVQSRKRKGFTLDELMVFVNDLRIVWGDFPLHVRVGFGPGGSHITEDVTHEDELIIQLKYMNVAC
jgi:hypothetical protein